MTDQEQAFKDWWEDGELLAGVTKKLAKEIFVGGYAMGSRRPVYQMSTTQYKLLVQMIIGDKISKIRAEEREECAKFCEGLMMNREDEEDYDQGCVDCAAAIRSRT